MRPKKSILDNIISRYRIWLTATSGPREIPNIIGIFVFASLALAFALITGVPAFDALRHGASSHGSFQWQAKDGQLVETPIQPLAGIDAALIVVSILAILSGIAFLLGWLERWNDA